MSLKYIALMLHISLIADCEAECKVHSTILRQLRKEGFHLELLSTVEIIVGSENCPRWEDCTLALVETIGTSFYANPDEISYREIDYCITVPVDTEKSERDSTPHIVYLFTTPNRILNLVQSDFKLPLHLRYHSPRTNGGFVLTTLHRPSLLIQCPQAINSSNSSIIRGPCPTCSNQTCDWLQMSFKTNAENLTVPVPVGDLDHLILVSAVTYLLAFGGSVYLTLTILQLVSQN